MQTSHRAVCAGLLVIALCCVWQPSWAQRIDLDPPPPGEFVLDYAELLGQDDEQHINELAAEVLREKAIPILVVTIDRMADYGGRGMRIETFATLLYNQWEIGHEHLGKEQWNKGVLLLVAYGDRFSRIELGAGFDREHDDMARRIMDEQIIVRFKRNDFSGGIVHGVEALGNMARGEKLPRGPFPWRLALVWAGFIGLAVFTVVSLIRRRASGWAWLFWGFVFSVLGYLLINAMRSGGSGGGFSGGSFGGGFSGGGGATGSW